MEEFRININKLMEQRGTTQDELALAIGVSQSTVSDWQRKGSVPKQNRLEKIAEFFGVTVGSLLEKEKIQDGIVYRGEEVVMSKQLFEAKEKEIEYLRKIIQQKEEIEKLKNIETVCNEE